jgi:hypothetical protein
VVVAAAAALRWGRSLPGTPLTAPLFSEPNRCCPPSLAQTEGEAFQQLLVAALKGVTRRVLLADQSVEYILKE